MDKMWVNLLALVIGWWSLTQRLLQQYHRQAQAGPHRQHSKRSKRDSANREREKEGSYEIMAHYSAWAQGK